MFGSYLPFLDSLSRLSYVGYVTRKPGVVGSAMEEMFRKGVGVSDVRTFKINTTRVDPLPLSPSYLTQQLDVLDIRPSYTGFIHDSTSPANELTTRSSTDTNQSRVVTNTRLHWTRESQETEKRNLFIPGSSVPWHQALSSDYGVGRRRHWEDPDLGSWSSRGTEPWVLPTTLPSDTLKDEGRNNR